ncbi:unnamed protein product, partial [Allacma fusca]
AHFGILELAQNINHLTKQFEDFQKIVLRQLVNISADVAQVTRILNQSSSVTAFEDFDIPGVVIPINSSNEFYTLNDWLITKDNKLKFITYLKGIGGIDTENFVKRVLGRLIGPDLANAANFTGTRDKLKFQGHL